MHYLNKELSPPIFIAGPCVIESESMCLKIALRLAELASRYRVCMVFKASYDKANRTSQNSFRGPGIKKGIKVLAKVKSESSLPILTDIHQVQEAQEAAAVADIIQIPAFLCRQTDLLHAAAATGKVVNIKKGQFMSAQQMKYSVEKAGKKVWVTERGTFFGYERLVVDFTSIVLMKSWGKPVIFDATHSVQFPSASKGCSGGNRKMALPLAKAAIAVGADGLFFEVHPQPSKALCDAANTISLKDFCDNFSYLLDLYRFCSNKSKI